MKAYAVRLASPYAVWPAVLVNDPIKKLGIENHPRRAYVTDDTLPEIYSLSSTCTRLRTKTCVYELRLLGNRGLKQLYYTNIHLNLKIHNPAGRLNNSARNMMMLQTIKKVSTN